MFVTHFTLLHTTTTYARPYSVARSSSSWQESGRRQRLDVDLEQLIGNCNQIREMSGNHTSVGGGTTASTATTTFSISTNQRESKILCL